MVRPKEPHKPNDRVVIHQFDWMFDGTSMKAILGLFGLGAAGAAGLASEGMVTGE